MLDLDGSSGGMGRPAAADFEVGDRSEATFLKLYGRLPEAEQSRNDGYRAYDCLPAKKHKGARAER